MPQGLKYLLLDLLTLAFVGLAVWHLTQKPGLPPAFASTERLSINNTPLTSRDEIEFYLNGFRASNEVIIGQDVPLRPIPVTLGLDQGTLLTCFDAFIACVLIGLGLFVIVRRPGEKAARIFHLASILTAIALVGTRTMYRVEPSALGIGLCAVFFVGYTILPVVFLHFTLVFPSIRWLNYRRLLYVLYGTGAAIALWSGLLYIRAAQARSIELFRVFVDASMLRNAFGAALFLGGIAIFVVAYRKNSTTSERRKIRWLLYGLTLGPAPFVLFWELPEAFGSSPWIAGWIFKLALLLIPATFAVSILKYRLLDIDLLINRSVVYTVVVGAAVGVYLVVLFGATQLVISFTPGASLISATAAMALLALGFGPAKRRVQGFVDRKFFRVQYNFRESLHRFTEDVKHCLDMGQIAETLVARAGLLLPVERLGYFTLAQPGSRLQLVASEGFDRPGSHAVHFEAVNLRSQLKLPIALDDKTEQGINHESGDAEVFRRWGMALVLPILSKQKDILGFFVLGPKKSGARFSVDDIDLLTAIATQAGLAIESITLQRSLLLERTEAQRLEELNRLKSYFVSCVSHDLKTPLTSIRMFAEIIRQRKNIDTSEAAEYLQIIEGECNRLTRLVNNVLDFAKIERGEREYHFACVDLNEIVDRVLFTLDYQLRIGSFTVDSTLSEEIITLHADADALMEALINLLSNAMKYSRDTKRIEVATFVSSTYAALQVRDHGIGISAEILPHIFEPFRRAKEFRSEGVGGTGLGLALVKDIVEAHNGRINVESDPGKGSTFRLLFPLEKETDTEHWEPAP